jgi:methylated-DNA-[protein]-cysteine S-methyltransferase
MSNLLSIHNIRVQLSAQQPSFNVNVYYERGVIECVKLNPHFSPEIICNFFSVQKDEKIEEVVYQWFIAYYAKKTLPILPLNWFALTPFTQQALRAVNAISFGTTKTYGDIAGIIGNPRAARGVGSACRRNPYPLFIPCHRVIDASRKLRGYSAGGISVKVLLLEFEGVYIKA